MKKWDYKILTVTRNLQYLKTKMEKIGEQGWELVSSGYLKCDFSDREDLLLFFKRETPKLPKPLITDSDSGQIE